MTKFHYNLVVSSLLYVMVCIMQDIVDIVGVVSKFMSNMGKNIIKKSSGWYVT